MAIAPAIHRSLANSSGPVASPTTTSTHTSSAGPTIRAVGVLRAKRDSGP
jgi:hypothetical protein